jgi:hypothetical protein
MKQELNTATRFVALVPYFINDKLLNVPLLSKYERQFPENWMAFSYVIPSNRDYDMVVVLLLEWKYSWVSDV